MTRSMRAGPDRPFDQWLEGSRSSEFEGVLAKWRKANPFLDMPVSYQARALEVAIIVAERVLKKIDRRLAPVLTESQFSSFAHKVMKFARKSALVPEEQSQILELVQDLRVDDLVRFVRRRK